MLWVTAAGSKSGTGAVDEGTLSLRSGSRYRGGRDKQDLAFLASVAGAGLCFTEWGVRLTQERWSQARADGLPSNDQPDSCLSV